MKCWQILFLWVISTSIIVVVFDSTSKPRTYALPAETLTDKRSSDGVFPWSVFCVSRKTPSLDIKSLREFATSTENLSTA